MEVPAERNAGCSIGFECLTSHWLTWRGGRTDGRSDGSNLTKISDFHALPNFVPHGAPRASSPLSFAITLW